MLCSNPTETVAMAHPVVIDHRDLLDCGPQAIEAITKAFSQHPDALGIILVKNVPGYSQLRQRLLPMASDVAQLSEEEKSQLELPEIQYMIGWSHGKEIVNGKWDTAKGSFYANPIHDQPTTDPEWIRQAPTYCTPNVWPPSLPCLRDAVKETGSLIVDVGVRLAHVFDAYLRTMHPDGCRVSIADTLRQTRAVKSRLLHYFAKPGSQSKDDWCGWHVDHSFITGLTKALFVRDGSFTESSGDVSAGLYIRTRGGQTVKVNIPADCLAFQTGEALEIATQGTLIATPHCVKSPGEAQVGRNTFAVFIQPDWTQQLSDGVSFMDLTAKKMTQHYSPEKGLQTEQ